MAHRVDAFQQVKQAIADLVEAARQGNIIPIRLPGQLEEIAQALDAALEADQDATSVAPTDFDLDAYMQEESYFLGHAIHELRTPMTSIRGYSDMLGSMGELNDMQKQFLSVIRTNTRRMEGLLADVSYANKIRKGTLKITPKMEMAKNILMRLEKDFMPLAEELQRNLTFDVPQGLPLLETDGDLLTIALGKFLENSIRYSPGEDGHVSVRAEAEGNTIHIIIEDNGIGMTEDEMAQLGTIYFRGENDQVREFKGSGLGIPIALGMIELLGGTVTINSVHGGGTRVHFSMKGMG